MANDSQRDKARAIFGKTFFANTKEPAPAKNAAAALQKRANARPIPTYKVGGVVKKNNGGAMSGRNTPEADDVLITTPRGKRILEEQRKREAEKAKAEAAKRARADKLLGIPAQKGGGKAGKYANGGILDRVAQAISDIANQDKMKKYGIPKGERPSAPSGSGAQRSGSASGRGNNTPVTVTRREESVTVTPTAPKTQTVTPTAPKTQTVTPTAPKTQRVKLNEKPKYVKLNRHKDGGKACGGKAGKYADGGKAMAGAKRAMKAEQDFTGLMKKAADRAAAKGTPVMKDGGPTDEYTAKRVMSRIKAGNFAEGGEAKDRMETRMRKVENAYKVALAKGKNEGIAKAKFERKKADIADDYAKKTGADRTATKAAEQAAKAALREARKTKGASMAKREFDELMAKKGSQSVAPKTVDVDATLKGLSSMPSAEAPKAKAATVARRAAPSSSAQRPTAQRPAGGVNAATEAMFARMNAKGIPKMEGYKPAVTPAAQATPRPAAARPAARPATPAATRPKDTVRTGRDIIADFFDTSAREKEIAKGASRVRDYAGERNKLLAERKARQQKMEEYNKIGRSQAGLAAAASTNRRFAAGGAAKVRKGMMKGK